MKKFLIALISAALIFSLAGCSSASGQYKNGTYTAEGKGRAGDVKVEVIIEKGSITAINVLDNSETEAMMESVKAGLLPKIIERQSAEGVDAVSGATLTSNGVLEAVKKVLDGDAKK